MLKLSPRIALPTRTLPLHPLKLQLQLQLRTLHASPLSNAKPLPPRPTIADDDISEAFLKGSGPGGQKINKTSSAVQLKHFATGLVVKCQETRSRSQNRKIARRILAERIEELEKGDQSRTALKTEVKVRKKASSDKKSRRKYKKLNELRKGGEGGGPDGEEGGVDGGAEAAGGEGETGVVRVAGEAGLEASPPVGKEP